MTKEELYATWAPSGAIWSPWVKPVLFACSDFRLVLDENFPDVSVQSPGESNQNEPRHRAVVQTGDTSQLFRCNHWEKTDTSWAPEPSEHGVVVVDLPGNESVWVGLSLAKRGYRPVPLYNSCPAPADWRQAAQSAESPTAIPSTVVDVRPVMDALWKGAEVLQQLVISADAPAAFLLDANRRGGGVEPKEGDFDNRAISFPTDFPSANFLLAHSIRRILLVQRMGLQPQPDLAHTLRRWQEAGIQVYGKSLDSSESPALINVERPSRFGLVWYRFLALIGFRRNLLGGFGGVVPDSSAG